VYVFNCIYSPQVAWAFQADSSNVGLGNQMVERNVAYQAQTSHPINMVLKRTYDRAQLSFQTAKDFFHFPSRAPHPANKNRGQ
jgi:hypothetical protein